MKFSKNYWVAGIAMLLLLFGAQAGLGFNPTDDSHFKKTKQCGGCDLSNTNLFGRQDFAGAGLRYSIVTNANLMQSNFSNAYFTNSNLIGANIASANLTNAKLDGANLTNAKLDNTNLSAARLSAANLNHATINSAVLPACRFP